MLDRIDSGFDQHRVPANDAEVLDAAVFADHGLEDDFSLRVRDDRKVRIGRLDLVNQKTFGNAARNEYWFRVGRPTKDARRGWMLLSSVVMKPLFGFAVLGEP